MALPRRPAGETDELDQRDQRKAGRLQCDTLRSPLGRVADLSGQGMRVVGRGRVYLKRGQLIMVRLQGLDGQMTLKAEVVWTKAHPLRRYSIGLRFLEITAREAQRLRQMAQTAMRRVSIARNGSIVEYR